MEKEIYKKYSLLDNLDVSRETYLDFEKFVSMIVKKIRK
jgi:16S rRNA (guanine527-N7)-methyltransferase